MEGTGNIEDNTPHEAKQYNTEHLIEKQHDPDKKQYLVWTKVLAKGGKLFFLIRHPPSNS